MLKLIDMPNMKGGKKFKKGKKQSFHDKKLIYKDPKEDQEYGKIIRACGNRRFQVECFDGKVRLGILAGNFHKKMWVTNDDIVLISKWEFLTDDDKCSIIHKYDRDEVTKLKSENEFPITISLESDNEFADFGNGSDDMISFDYGYPNESESDSEEDKKKDVKEEDEQINLDDI